MVGFKSLVRGCWWGKYLPRKGNIYILMGRLCVYMERWTRRSKLKEEGKMGVREERWEWIVKPRCHLRGSNGHLLRLKLLKIYGYMKGIWMESTYFSEANVIQPNLKMILDTISRIVLKFCWWKHKKQNISVVYEYTWMI